MQWLEFNHTFKSNIWRGNLCRQADRRPRPCSCTPSPPPKTCPPSSASPPPPARPSCAWSPPLGTDISSPDQMESDWNRIWAKVSIAALDPLDMSYLYLFWIAFVELFSPRSLCWISVRMAQKLVPTLIGNDNWSFLNFWEHFWHLAAWTQFWEQGPHSCHLVQPPSTEKANSWTERGIERDLGSLEACTSSHSV